MQGAQGGAGGDAAGAGGEGGTAPAEPCELMECGGSCVDTQTSVAHCGGCDRACFTDSRTTAACVEGACAPTCSAGFADCSHPEIDDGCETNLNANATCGTSCDNLVQCEGGQICKNGACVPASECELTLCGVDTCVDLNTGSAEAATTDHCGACDYLCGLDNASSAACSNGQCAPTCKSGFADCSTPTPPDQDDGCETNVASGSESGESTIDCGECGRECSLTNAVTASCEHGKCAPICSPGFGDCNADDGTGVDDGCETNLNMLTSCGTTCANRKVCTGNETCENGVCVKPNLITAGTNGTFETGTSGWYTWGGGTLSATSTLKHSGAQSLMTTTAPAATNVTSLVTPGVSYTGSAWVTITGADEAKSVNMTLSYKCGGDPVKYQWLSAKTTTNENWVLLEGSHTIPAGCDFGTTPVQLYVEGTALSGVTLYVDDVALR